MKLLRERRGPATAVRHPGLARWPPPAAVGEGLREEEELVPADLGFTPSRQGRQRGVRGEYIVQNTLYLSINNVCRDRKIMRRVDQPNMATFIKT
jgi:hypothetical protein